MIKQKIDVMNFDERERIEQAQTTVQLRQGLHSDVAHRLTTADKAL